MHLIPGQSFFNPSIRGKGMDATKKPSVDYDEEADVLYVTLGTGEPSYCEEVDDRLLVERGISSKDPTGYRIIHFKRLCEEVLGPRK